MAQPLKTTDAVTKKVLTQKSKDSKECLTNRKIEKTKFRETPFFQIKLYYNIGLVGVLFLGEPFLPISTGLTVVILSNQARMCSSLRLLLRFLWESDFSAPNMDGSRTVQIVRDVSPTYN